MTTWTFEEMLEKLAAQEHEQWMDWTKHAVDNQLVTDPTTVSLWRHKWVSYSELSEIDKEACRQYAHKVTELLFVVIMDGCAQIEEAKK